MGSMEPSSEHEPVKSEADAYCGLGIAREGMRGAGRLLR